VGHKDIKTTALYKKSQVNKEEMRGVLKKLDKVMFKKKADILKIKTNKRRLLRVPYLLRTLRHTISSSFLVCLKVRRRF